MKIEEVKDRLEKELTTVDILALEPHYKRESLFFVDGSLDIVEVGAHVAVDDKAYVQEILSSTKLAKPNEEKMAKLKQDLQKQYLFVIVQPFVFAQEILN